MKSRVKGATHFASKGISHFRDGGEVGGVAGGSGAGGSGGSGNGSVGGGGMGGSGMGGGGQGGNGGVRGTGVRTGTVTGTSATNGMGRAPISPTYSKPKAKVVPAVAKPKAKPKPAVMPMYKQKPVGLAVSAPKTQVGTTYPGGYGMTAYGRQGAGISGRGVSGGPMGKANSDGKGDLGHDTGLDGFRRGGMVKGKK
jgi:hypothetical protein